MEQWVVSSLAVPGSIPLHMSTVAIKIDSVSISKNDKKNKNTPISISTGVWGQ